MFLYRLALAMGRLDVDELEKELTPSQFYGWMEYWKQEPFGLDWHRTATHAYYDVAVMGGKPGNDFINKFLPSYDPHPTMTEAEMAAEFAKLKRPRNGA